MMDGRVGHMRFALLILIFLAACGRPLTETEKSFLQSIHGDSLDTSKVRLIKNAPLKVYTLSVPKRPRVTCQERLFPEPEEEVITGAPGAVAYKNWIFLNRDFSLPNYTPTWPDRLYLLEAMFLAHEMTHVWQWQNRELTGYSPWKAAREHQVSEDPYLFDLNTNPDFLSFGYEQQGSIVEEYLCCATLAPASPRTARLEAMLKEVFPLQSLPPLEVIKPWDGAVTEGICD